MTHTRDDVVQQATTSYQAPRDWAPRFFTIWIGQMGSWLGSMLVQFVLIWWLTIKTGSATTLSGAVIAGVVPQIFLTPVAGALIDRWNRRVVMIGADGMIALATVGLAVLFWLNMAAIWHVYLLMFVRSAASGFHWPAMDASVPLMVPRQHLTRVQGINQAVSGGMNIIAPPLGALLLTVLPMQGILAIDVGTAALAITPLLFLAVPQPEQRAGQNADGSKSSVWQDMRAGWRYVRAWRGMTALLFGGSLLFFLLTPLSTLLPILVTEHFNGGAQELAWIESAWGIGVVIGGLVLGVWGGFERRILTTVLGITGISLFSLIVGLTPASAFWLALVATFGLGTAGSLSGGPIYAAIQAAVAPDMAGRVLTLMNSAILLMTPLAMVIAGPVADLAGPRAWYLVASVGLALLAGSIRLTPSIMHLEDSTPEANSSPPAIP
ncbi:MAG: MFS transporter [Anaerolineae bacterium]|nr:MFS transporter [Anaerolineae bacterium]